MGFGGLHIANTISMITPLRILTLTILLSIPNLTYAINCTNSVSIIKSMINGDYSSQVALGDSLGQSPHLYINESLYLNSKLLFDGFNYSVLTTLDPLNLILLKPDIDFILTQPVNSAMARVERNLILNSTECVGTWAFTQRFVQQRAEALELASEKIQELRQLHAKNVSAFTPNMVMNSKQDQLQKWAQYISNYEDFTTGYNNLLTYLNRFVDYNQDDLQAFAQLAANLSSLDPYSAALTEIPPVITFEQEALPIISSSKGDLLIVKSTDQLLDLSSNNNQIMDEKRSLIIDLRQLSGGIPQEALDLTYFFTGQKQCVIVHKRNNKQSTQCSSHLDKTLNKNKKIIVLTNDSTRSSGEILALGLKAAPHVHTMGTNTFGKATLQYVLMDLPEAFNPVKALSLTVGIQSDTQLKTWQGTGVPPDISHRALKRINRQDHDRRMATQRIVRFGNFDIKPLQQDHFDEKPITPTQRSCYEKVLSQSTTVNFTDTNDSTYEALFDCLII